MYIIAEAGSVHDGSFGNAKNLIMLAKECGADAIKFQVHISESETLIDAPSPSYFNGESRYDYFIRTSFKQNEWKILSDFSRDLGLGFIVSPFSIEAVDYMSDINVDWFKVASGEVTNTPLLEKLSVQQTPIILSSGMSNWEDLDRATKILSSNKSNVIMQCTSQYPCKAENAGINIVKEMQKRYEWNVGFSDHTMTPTAAICAVYSGATFIEKHITFSRKMYGSDAKYAMEPNEFTNYCNYIKEASIIKENNTEKINTKELIEMKEIFEKSIVALKDIKKGSEIKNEMVGCKKPGTGMPPFLLNKVIGKRANVRIKKGTQIEKDQIN